MKRTPVWKKGNELSAATQQEALCRFVHRFTRDNVPAWAKKEWKDGKPYPVQFDSDREWLEHTEFAIRKDGALDNRVNYCFSVPTWPDNPELRANHHATDRVKT